MDKKPSLAALALAGVERMRGRDHDFRGRVCALLLLLRGAYYTGEGKWRALAEEDLRALWRGGVHDHIGGGFFSASTDGEWLRPRFEKRLDDNAILAFLYTEAWEKGRMGFYREAAEEALDFCLRDLADPSGLYRRGQYAAQSGEGENPYLFTPAQIAAILPGDEGRHFAACYDITDEDNCPGGSIPNLILNRRWSFMPEGYDDLRERVRLAREERGGLVTDESPDGTGSALLLAALAKAARVFSDRRYLAAAEELAAKLPAQDAPDAAERAALCFALTELYAADFAPARISAAAAIAPAPEELLRASDRALSLAALGFAALLRLTGEERWRGDCAALLLGLARQRAVRGPESLAALCAEIGLDRPRALLCLSPGERPPAALGLIAARYAPELAILLKTPARAASLAAAAPWTAALEIGETDLFYSVENGKIGAPQGL